MANYTISKSVISRLPKYYRFLGELLDNGVERTSSGMLAKKMGFTASQIRQDLNCFGGFGQQGYGYNVRQLHIEIGEILGISNKFNTVIVGAGNLGRAIANYISFERRGFNIIGIFDENEALAGQMIKGQPIRHISVMDEFCNEYKPDVAVLCVPSQSAKSVTEQLIELGVKGFWNFTNYDISMEHPNVEVENVHLNDSLMTFCYRMTERYKNN